MKGSECKFVKYMEGSDKRFVIPVYQRNYDWKTENCKQLYDDLVKIIKGNRKSHFFGSLVSVYNPDELFHNDPSYFGLTKEDLKDDELQLIVDIYEQVSLEDNISNSDREILLRENEIVAIKKLMPLSQNRTNDNLNKNRSAIVKEAIKKLKLCNK